MANKITGKTDINGALTAVPSSVKSIVVVGRVKGSATSTSVKEKEIFSITGTADATAVFGADSIVPKMVRVLIANGVNNIKGIVVPATGDTALADTLEATLQDKTVKVIITDSNDQTDITAVKDHLILAESNDLFRYSVFAPNEDDAKNQTSLTNFAKTVDSDRIFIPGPSVIYSSAVADPQIFAAGLASKIMTETSDPALPMNGVPILGFSGVTRTMLDAEMSALAHAGVTPIYPEGTTPTIYRLVTSKLDNAVWQEGTTRFIADHVLESVESMLRANYQRTKNVVRILESIRDDVKVVLEGLNSLEIIENFDESTLTVTKDPQDLYGALIDYEFDVVTPLYTITINQHLKL